MTLTAEEVQKILMGRDGFWIDELVEDVWYNDNVETFEVPGIGIAHVLEHEVGKGSGTIEEEYYSGDPVWDNWVIFNLKGQTFKVTGQYNSWDGIGPTGVVEVRAVEKIITVWEEV